MPPFNFVSGIKRFLGNITAHEDATTITIDGIPADVLSRDIQKEWSTSRINQYMFSQLGNSKIKFPKFFAPEVAYMLDQLTTMRYRRTNIRAINRILDELKEHTWLAGTQAKLPDILDFKQLERFRYTMLKHQMDFLQIYNTNVPKYQLKGFLLGAVAGSGKTITSLATAACLHADHVLIITPKRAVFDVWRDTIRDQIKDPESWWVYAEGKPMSGLPHYLIYHYEVLDEALKIAEQFIGKKLVIILDESHNFNEITAQRTGEFVDLCRKTQSQNIIWASGTPVKAVGSEAIPMLRTIDRLFTPDTEERFKMIFGKNAARANDILAHRMGFVSFKVPKEAVMGDVPKPIESEVKVSLANGKQFTLDAIREEMRAFIVERVAFYKKHMNEYVDIYNKSIDLHRKTLSTSEQHKRFAEYQNYIKQIRVFYDPKTMASMGQYCNWYEKTRIMPQLPQDLRKQFADARSVVKYVYLKVQGECLGRILGKRRADCNVALVPYAKLEETIDGAEKKTIIFTSNVEVVKACDKFLTARGYDTVVVYGDTNKDILAILDRFRTDPDANPVIATYQSLSTAIPLTSANRVILMNQPFRDYERDQAISRAYRLGQDTQVEVFNVLLDTGDEPNISTRSQDILEWSKQQVAEIMGMKTVVDAEAALESFSEPEPMPELPLRELQW